VLVPAGLLRRATPAAEGNVKSAPALGAGRRRVGGQGGGGRAASEQGWGGRASGVGAGSLASTMGARGECMVGAGVASQRAQGGGKGAAGGRRAGAWDLAARLGRAQAAEPGSGRPGGRTRAAGLSGAYTLITPLTGPGWNMDILDGSHLDHSLATAGGGR
jgi:hypothetical protein